MTLKQKLVAKKILENPGLPISTAMKQVGYSENTATNPKDLTESKGWQELMDKYLPDPDVIQTHKEGLKANKIITSHTEPDYEYPDHAIRLRAVELAYRVKNKFQTGIQILNQGDMEIQFTE